MKKRRKPRERDLVGPVILVGLGITLLLINMGVWEWDVLWTLVRIWPVLLIASGIDLLVGRRSLLGSLVALVLIVAVAGGAFWLAWTGTGALSPENSVQVVHPLDDATRAEVSLNRSAGGLHVGPLVDSPNLIEGIVYLDNGKELEQAFDIEDGVAVLSLSGAGYTGGPAVGVGAGTAWEMDISDAVPFDLAVNFAVGGTRLDLTGLLVESVDVDMAIGQTTIILPAEGDIDVSVEGAIGQLVVTVPQGMAVRIQAGTALVIRQFPDGYERQGDMYTLPGYENAANRADVNLGLAIGSVVVRTDEGD